MPIKLESIKNIISYKQNYIRNDRKLANFKNKLSKEVVLFVPAFNKNFILISISKTKLKMFAFILKTIFT